MTSTCPGDKELTKERILELLYRKTIWLDGFANGFADERRGVLTHVADDTRHLLKLLKEKL